MSARAMSIVHRVVIGSSILGAAAMWFVLREMTQVSTAQTVFLMIFPGAAVAIACYCVCMVFGCLGRR